MDVSQVKVEVIGTDKSGNAFSSALKRANEYGKTISSVNAPISALDSNLQSMAANANKSFAQNELSAKQMAAAMRGVPAQITDIIVSLQGGQPVLNVLLQQGGQLKDMFGGVGNAYRALSQYVVGLINPFTLATAAAVGLFAVFQRTASITDEFNRAIISTGSALTTTGNGLQGIATYAGQVTNQYGLAREATLALAEANIFTMKQIETGAIGAVAASELLGVGINKTTEMMISLGKDPVKGIIDLDKQFNILNGTTLQQINHLESIGRHEQAVNIALKAVTDTMRERGDEFGEKLGWWGSLMKYFSEWASNAGKNIEKIGNIGAEQDPLQELKARRDSLKNFSGFELYSDRSQRLSTIEDLNRQISLAEKLAREAQGYVKEQTRIKNNERDLLESGSLRSTQVQKLVTEYRKIAELQQLGKISKSDGEILLESTQEKLKALYEKPKEKKDTLGDELKQLEQVNKLIAEGATVEDARTIARLKGQGATEAYIKSYMSYTESINAATKAEKEAEEVKKQLAQAAENQLAQNQQYISSIYDQVKAAESELANYGLLPSEITKATLAELERAKAISFSIGLTEKNVELIQAQIDLYKRLSDSQAGTEAKKSADKAMNQREDDAKELARQAKKAADDIQREYDQLSQYLSRSITDGLMRGFENGKSLADNFKDTLINMFKTLTLEPIIRLIVDESGITRLMQSATSYFKAGDAESSLVASPNSNVIDRITEGFKSINTTFTSSIENLGIFLSNGQGGLGDTIGGFLGQYSSEIASGLGYLSSAYMLSQGNVAGAALTAVGTYFGGPIGGAIGGAVGSLFGGKKKIPRFSSQSDTLYNDGDYTTRSYTPMYKALNANKQTTALNEAYFDALSPLFKAFNIEDQLQSASTRIVQKRKASYGGFNAVINDQKLFSGATGSAKSTQKTFEELVNTVLTQGISKAVNASTMGDGLKSLFDNLTDKTQVGNMINATINLANTQDALAQAYGLSANTAALVAKASGYADDSLVAFVTSLNNAAMSQQSAASILIKEREALAVKTGMAPTTLSAFDALLKTIDTTTLDGQTKFADLFGVRDRVTSYTSAMDEINKSLENSLYGLISPSEQLAISQQKLVESFGELNMAVPGSTQELAAWIRSIDMTTESGLKAAMATPALVQMFEQVQDSFKSMVGNLSTDYFSTYADYASAKSAVSNGDSPAQFIKSQAQMNAQLIQQLDEMKQSNADLKAYLTVLSENAAKQQRTLEDWDLNGMPEVRVE